MTNEFTKSPFDNLARMEAFLHCGMCLKELPRRESPQSFARLSVGWTQRGLQVWCVRHNVNVIHIDFQGHQHPAILTCKRQRP